MSDDRRDDEIPWALVPAPVVQIDLTKTPIEQMVDEIEALTLERDGYRAVLGVALTKLAHLQHGLDAARRELRRTRVRP